MSQKVSSRNLVACLVTLPILFHVRLIPNPASLRIHMSYAIHLIQKYGLLAVAWEAGESEGSRKVFLPQHLCVRVFLSR